MTNWILVDKNLAPNERPILCSCESFRKRSLTSIANGDIKENIVHGIASVFCPPEYRRRGYATRHMKEMAKLLRSWQSEQARCVVGSVLYSDIGKTYYANLGWHPAQTNTHVAFQPMRGPKSQLVKNVVKKNLAQLCNKDEEKIRDLMATPAQAQTRLAIIPDLDHMLWHIRKEEFTTKFLFDGNIPRAKGAIAGRPGRQVWVIWMHRYYGRIDAESPGNVLYILRLVVEGQQFHEKSSMERQKQQTELHNEQVNYLKAVIQAAQAEAAGWKLDYVRLWGPTPLIQSMTAQSGIEHSVVERREDSIASGLWYDENGERGPAPEWLHNEHYAWCWTEMRSGLATRRSVDSIANDLT